MTAEQMLKLLARLIEFATGFNVLTKDEAQWVIEKPKDVIAVCVGAIQKAYAETQRVLELLGTTLIPATTANFVAEEKFVLGTGPKANVKISYLGDNFNNWFGNKVEDPILDQTLRYHKLLKSSVDAPIIAELGGEAKAETSLSGMYSLMEKQKNGEAGVLLNNGYANIFYIKDIAGVLRTVLVYWHGVGWCVVAGSVDGTRELIVVDQVFSRN